MLAKQIQDHLIYNIYSVWTPSWPLCLWDWNNLKGGFWLHFSCPNIWVGMDSSSGHREYSWLFELVNLLCPIIENHPEGLKGVCVFCDFSIQATDKQIEILVTSLWKEPQRYTLPSCPSAGHWLIESRQVYFFVTNSVRLYFWGSKITADGDCSHEINRRLLLGRKVMTNLDSILKSRDIT